MRQMAVGVAEINGVQAMNSQHLKVMASKLLEDPMSSATVLEVVMVEVLPAAAVLEANATTAVRLGESLL
jgi:hypothetical protein